MNTKYHNYRNSVGQFAKKPSKKVYRLTNGRFTNRPAEKVVAGRLYIWKGVVCRASKIINNKRLVTIHKNVFGFVTDNQLSKANKSEVEDYLAYT